MNGFCDPLSNITFQEISRLFNPHPAAVDAQIIITGISPFSLYVIVVAKANDSYYLLKKTACPIVIVECGFLSNPQEEALLTDSVYQERVAWNIFMGIMQELKMKKE